MTDAENHSQNSGTNWIPIPDPTKLTTEAVDRAIAQSQSKMNQLQELMEAKLALLQSEVSIGDQLNATRLNDLRALLDERHVTEIRIFQDARESALESVRAALTSSEKAIDKAEAATEKRFESVNEFRAQQADLIARFMTRTEYSAAHETLAAAVTELRSQLDNLSGTIVPRTETEAWRNALVSKVDDGLRGLTERIAAVELRLTSRLDTSAGQITGAEQHSVQSRAERTEQRLNQGALVSMVIMAVGIVGLVITLVTVLH